MNFVKTTVIGGIVFLVPVIIVVAILGKAFELVLLVAKPLDQLLLVDSIGGVAVAILVALLMILIFCFIAGIIAQSGLAKKVYHALDNALLAIPGYAIIKAYTDSMKTSEEEVRSFQPVLVHFVDNSQLGFEVERLENSRVVAYLPGAPNSWSGTVAYLARSALRNST